MAEKPQPTTSPSPPPVGFKTDEADAIIRDTIDKVIQNAPYSHTKVAAWNQEIVEKCLKGFTALNRPYKYIVTCVIMQKTGAGLHATSSCYWDSTSDGGTTIRWENKSLHCVVSVFAVAI